uniref:Uncharacterized protein n=1 Tax=Brassica campestris TaxID=3711 RepID=A0A3P6DPQ0_BRACM|nr:unnamed protein product [Brassica rapa]
MNMVGKNELKQTYGPVCHHHHRGFDLNIPPIPEFSTVNGEEEVMSPMPTKKLRLE